MKIYFAKQNFERRNTLGAVTCMKYMAAQEFSSFVGEHCLAAEWLADFHNIVL